MVEESSLPHGGQDGQKENTCAHWLSPSSLFTPSWSPAYGMETSHIQDGFSPLVSPLWKPLSDTLRDVLY
jgi:hypothetical protein